MVTVELEGQPVKVWFQHHNSMPSVYYRQVKVITECRLILPDGSEFADSGFAACSMGDNFNRNLGRKLALTRAVKDLPKEQRRTIWNAYHSARGKF